MNWIEIDVDNEIVKLPSAQAKWKALDDMVDAYLEKENVYEESND